MAAIHVCPLAHVHTTLLTSGAEHVISLLAPIDRTPVFPDVAPHRHLLLSLSDITLATPGHVLAASTHVGELLRFVHGWDRRSPLLVHCFAGVSRSTAAAFVALCALDPARPEADHAAALRAASSTATPNARLVALADQALARAGRMTAAVAAIGRGAECFAGGCFTLKVPDLAESNASPGKLGYSLVQRGMP